MDWLPQAAMLGTWRSSLAGCHWLRARGKCFFRSSMSLYFCHFQLLSGNCDADNIDYHRKYYVNFKNVIFITIGSF